MSRTKALIGDLIKYAPSQVVPALAGFISIPILTRLFPPQDYGRYMLVMATISVLTTLSGWLVMSVIRFYPALERDGRLEELCACVLVGVLIFVPMLAGLFTAIVFLARLKLEKYLHQLMLVAVIVFALTAIFEILQSFLQAKRKATWYSLFSTWKSGGGLVIGIGLVVVLRFGVEGLLWGSALNMALSLPLLWKIAIGRFPRIANFSAELTKEMVKYSLPLVVGNLAAWVLSLSDRYILGFFRGAHEVGIYSASYAVSEKSILLLTTLFLLASGPISIHVWEKEGEQRARDFVTSVTRYYLLLCIPAAVGLSVLARPVMGVLAGAEYREGYRIIPFVALSGFLFGLQQRFQVGLVFYKKTHFIMIPILIAGLVNLGLNLIFVPIYGYMAAAITKLIGYTVLLAIMAIYSRRYFIWAFCFKSLARAALAAAIMGALVYPIGNGLTSSTLINLIFGICVGVIVYTLMLFLLQEPRKGEIQSLRELGVKIFGSI